MITPNLNGRGFSSRVCEYLNWDKVSAQVWLLGGSWVVISRVISRVTTVIGPIRGLLTLLITTHEPPSRERFQVDTDRSKHVPLFKEFLTLGGAVCEFQAENQERPRCPTGDILVRLCSAEPLLQSFSDSRGRISESRLSAPDAGAWAHLRLPSHTSPKHPFTAAQRAIRSVSG